MCIWTTKEGIEIDIKDMTNSHLANTIKYLKKKMDEFDDLPYPCFQGELAQESAEIEYDRTNYKVTEMIDLRDEMIKEANERRLKWI